MGLSVPLAREKISVNQPLNLVADGFDLVVRQVEDLLHLNCYLLRIVFLLVVLEVDVVLLAS